MGEELLKKISKGLKRLGLRGPKNKATSAILTYHGVSETSQKNCVPVEIFRAHLAYLSENFTIISLSDMLKRITEAKEVSENLIALTFDDAYENFLSQAYPLLQHYHIPATVFVPAKLIDHYNSWDLDNNTEYSRLKIMSLGELLSMDPEIVELGSHTSNHLRLSSLDDEQLKDEIVGSKTLLETELQRDIRYFAYPYGELKDFDIRAINFLSHSNYQAAFTTHFRRYGPCDDPFTIGRISVFDNDQVADLEAKLSGYYDWLRYKEKLAYKIKTLLKK